MTSPTDALRERLLRQAAVLSPVSAHLAIAAAHPPRAPHDWHGPASVSYQALEAQLAARIGSAAEAVTAALDATRHALILLDAVAGDPARPHPGRPGG